MTHTFSYSINETFVEKLARLQKEYEEQMLAEIITKYDFIVGSIECKRKLMEVLPEGANIICSPYIVDSTKIYAIKKFDITDLLTESYRVENEDVHDNTEIVDTTNTVDESQDYQPTCPRGYKDCVYDPAYIKYNYPEWYAKLYDSLSVEEASNQSCRLKVEEDPDEEYGCYDDEDK